MDWSNITVELSSLELTLSQNLEGRAVIDQQKAILSQKLFKVNAGDLITKAQQWKDTVAVHNVEDYLSWFTSEGDLTSFSSFTGEDVESLCPSVLLEPLEIVPDKLATIGRFFVSIGNFLASIQATVATLHCTASVLIYVLIWSCAGALWAKASVLIIYILMDVQPDGIIARSIVAILMSPATGIVVGGGYGGYMVVMMDNACDAVYALK